MVERAPPEGLTQRGLAKILGVDSSSVMRWETGRRPRREFVDRIEALLACCAWRCSHVTIAPEGGGYHGEGEPQGRYHNEAAWYGSTRSSGTPHFHIKAQGWVEVALRATVLRG